MNMSDANYRSAAMADEADALTEAIIASVNRIVNISDGDVRTAVIASSLMTAAQVLDGNEMPRDTNIIKPNGVADSLSFLCDKNRGK